MEPNSAERVEAIAVGEAVSQKRSSDRMEEISEAESWSLVMVLCKFMTWPLYRFLVFFGILAMKAKRALRVWKRIVRERKGKERKRR
jgi:hypothetical protein